MRLAPVLPRWRNSRCRRGRRRVPAGNRRSSQTADACSRSPRRRRSAGRRSGRNVVAAGQDKSSSRSVTAYTVESPGVAGGSDQLLPPSVVRIQPEPPPPRIRRRPLGSPPRRAAPAPAPGRRREVHPAVAVIGRPQQVGAGADAQDGSSAAAPDPRPPPSRHVRTFAPARAVVRRLPDLRPSPKVATRRTWRSTPDTHPGRSAPNRSMVQVGPGCSPLVVRYASKSVTIQPSS